MTPAVLMLTRDQADAVAVALQLARDLKASVLVLSNSPTKPDPLLIQQARKLDAALLAIEASRH